MKGLLDILGRIHKLLIKLLGVKGVVFIIATVLMFNSLLDVTMWSFFAAGFCGLRTLDKLILKDKGNG